MKEVVFPGVTFQNHESTAKNLVILCWQDLEMPSVMAGSAYGSPNSRPYARFSVDPTHAFLEVIYK